MIFYEKIKKSSIYENCVKILNPNDLKNGKKEYLRKKDLKQFLVILLENLQ